MPNHYLCFDISSGGISAALFDSQLENPRLAESPWRLETDERGAAAFSVDRAITGFKDAIRALNLAARDAIDAICIGSFMHNCVLLDESGQALTPLYTWLDSRGEGGLQFVRSRLGDRFHDITGCRYHPMFPVFKLAAIRSSDSPLLGRMKRIVSLKAALLNRLTGAWIEDLGMASASGLLNITTGDWDPEVLDVLGLTPAHLPRLAGPADIVGSVSPHAEAEFGIRAGIPVIAGSGDGFLANVGSGCEAPERIAVTLGTSAVARQTLGHPVIDLDAGTFCYRASVAAYLLGCAGSNGGNVLDWGRQILGPQNDAETSEAPPILVPLLHGERSPDWDPRLTGSWYGLTARHTAADLSRSILEGVIFNLAHFVEIVQRTSGKRAADIVLSGNGFLNPAAAPILAGVTGTPTWIPAAPGLASLKGAAICAQRALRQPEPQLRVDRVSPPADQGIVRRYDKYRRLRAASGA